MNLVSRKGQVILVSLSLTACGELLTASPHPLERTDSAAAAPLESRSDGGLALASEPRSPETLDAGPDAPSSVLASSVLDFSGTQGSGGWSYGFVAPSTSPAFRPLTHFDGTAWSLPGVAWLVLTASGGSPDATTSSTERWAVRRWTSPIAGAADVALRFYKTETSCGNGMDARLIVNGAERWTRFIAFDDAIGVTDTVPVTLAIGTTLDLVLAPHLQDDKCDHAAFTAVVEGR